MRSVGGGSERLHLDTADTFAFNGSDLDVTLVTPSCTPGVSYDVVLFTTLSSVTNSGDGVVKVGTASSGVENTAVVHLEDRLVGFDGDGNDTLVKGGHELGLGVLLEELSTSNSNLTTRSHASIASTSLSLSRGVWVVALKSLWV